MRNKDQLVALNVKIPKKFKDMMYKYVDSGLHKDISELTRDAIREKIKRDAPDFYLKMLQE